jgi:serine/threonine protein kinase/outer membrane protein assembly factor BamB
MTDLDLRSIPGYVVHERIETDLVSSTYLAERQSDGYPVVLQVITEKRDDPEVADAFFNAHERVMQIKHPVIPDVWDTGRIDGVLYSVTEAVEGRSLASTLEGAGRLSLETALSVCSELADTLDILHAADVVHGALNPHTIWINDRTRAPSAPWVTLRGFGTAAMLSLRASTDRQDPPPADMLYVAPEQIRQEEITGRVDQYALACMIVHCLTGAPPFQRATINALIGAHLFAAPRSSDGSWDVLQPHVTAAVRRAMAKDPADRFSLCSAFATAIGGGRQRSWTWMIEDALSADTDDEISLVDEPTSHMDADAIAAELGTAATADAIAAELGTAATRDGSPADTAEMSLQLDLPQSQAVPDHVAAHAFAEADWLPNSATKPPSTTPRAPAEPLPNLAPPQPARRHLDPQVLRWLVIVSAAIVIITAALLFATRGSASPPAAERAAPDTQDVAEPPVPSAQGVPAWQRNVGRQPMTAMLNTDRTLVGGAGDVLTAIDPATGRSRWRASLTGEVMEVAFLEEVVIARTADALHAFDEDTGREMWSTADDPVAPVAMATGRASLYEVTIDGGAIAVHSLMPATGDVLWSITGMDAAAADTSAVYDRSRLGQQMLYVLNGSQLHAIDTSYRRLRWETTLEQPKIGSLTAIAKAILVISADGQICRYGMQDGDEVWTKCATLQTATGARAVIHTRNARVLVRSAREIAAVDFTSGVPHWRVADGAGFQEPFAANTDMAFVVHANGSVEGIDHQKGVERWRSEPLGDVTAMTAGDGAVYVATADGDVTRFNAEQK